MDDLITYYEALKKDITESKEFEPDSDLFKTAILILLGTATQQIPTIRKITGYTQAFLYPRTDRLRHSGIWRRRKRHKINGRIVIEADFGVNENILLEWANANTSIPFLLDVLYVNGEVTRKQKGNEEPTYSLTTQEKCNQFHKQSSQPENQLKTINLGNDVQLPKKAFIDPTKTQIDPIKPI